MRNLIIDTSKANMKSIAGLHWQVAQATSIYNVRFYGSADRSKEHIGICKAKNVPAHTDPLRPPSPKKKKNPLWITNQPLRIQLPRMAVVASWEICSLAT